MAKTKRNSKFLDESNWSLINHGWIFEAAVPYVSERPLDFFIPNANNPDTGTVVNGTKVQMQAQFLDGKEKQVVLKVKPRKVLILSNDELNHDASHYDVTVAKIYSIKDSEHSEPWYDPTVEGTHPFFVYLESSITGKECYIDLSTVTTIHKNMLLEEKLNISPVMESVGSKLEYCLSALGMYRDNKKDDGVIRVDFS